MKKKCRWTRGQIPVFTVVFIAIMFIIVLAMGLGGVIIQGSQIAVHSGGLTGVEAFIVDNMIVWVILAFIIWIIWMSQ